jgi:hypothetical protein
MLRHNWIYCAQHRRSRQIRNKLTIDFDKAGQKRVLDGFVAAV